MEFSVGLTASGQCFKLNLSLIIFFSGNPGGRGVFCPGNPDKRGGLVVQEIQVRGGGGLKNDPIRRGGVDFFWNNPFLFFIVLWSLS